MPIFIVRKVRTLLEWAYGLLSKKWGDGWMVGVDIPQTVMTTKALTVLKTSCSELFSALIAPIVHKHRTFSTHFCLFHQPSQYFFLQNKPSPWRDPTL